MSHVVACIKDKEFYYVILHDGKQVIVKSSSICSNCDFTKKIVSPIDYSILSSQSMANLKKLAYENEDVRLTNSMNQCHNCS